MSHPVSGATTTGFPPVRRTAGKLADDREIFYYDDRTTTPRTTPDGRVLGHRTPAGELRHDALTGDWVAIAGHRSERTFLPAQDACPLCPTGPGRSPTEVPEGDYDVVVFENRFPSFATHPALAAVTAPDEVRTAADSPVGLFAGRPAAGRCEVICFTSDHHAHLSTLPVERVRTVVEAWADRTASLSRASGVEHVFCFENQGVEIGVTLHHPHGQIYAYPYVPARTAAMLRQAKEHHGRTGRLLGADLLAAERAEGTRMIMDGRHWAAYVPYAARWPVEVHLVPTRDVPDLAALTTQERDELATVYRDLLGLLDTYYSAQDGRPTPMPYIAAWHQAPVHTGRDVSRLHLQVFSILRAPNRLKYLAGSESGAGAWVNDVAPETIAQRLREAAT